MGNTFRNSDFGVVPKQAKIHWADIANPAIIALGAGLRIYQWLLNRSLWLDESYLAVNLVERGFGELHKPLEYSQSAPYLFLVATKVVVSLLGPSELALRLIPLVASIASLWVFWLLAQECLSRRAVPLAVAIFALAYQPLYYAQELKQYSLEFLLTVLISWLAARMFNDPDRSNTRLALIGLVGLAGIYAMHAMPFLLAGIGLTAFWARRKGAIEVSCGFLALVVGVWLGAFALNYFVIIKHNYGDVLMKNYWAFAYPGKPWTQPGLRSWYVLINEYSWYLGYEHVVKLVFGGLVVTGSWTAFRSKRWIAIAATISIGAYWLAASAGRAPFYGRLVLWMFPLLILIAVQAVEAVMAKRRAAGIALAGLLLWPSIAGIPELVAPIKVEGMREVAERLSLERRPVEPVYVFFWAQPGLRYYQRQFPNLTDGLVLGAWDYTRERQRREGVPPSYQLDADKLVPEIEKVDRRNGFWILLTHLSPPHEAELLRQLSLRAGLTPDRSYTLRRTSMYHFGPRA